MELFCYSCAIKGLLDPQVRTPTADLGMRCPISLTPVTELKYPVCKRNSAQHAVYELRELCQWYRVAGTDPLTRKRITWKHIILAGQPPKKIQQLILHEMSTSLVLEPVVDYLAVYQAYADNFEGYFCIFASSLTGPCYAIRMRVRMFPARIMASIHLFSCWLLLRLHCSCFKKSSKGIS